MKRSIRLPLPLELNGRPSELLYRLTLLSVIILRIAQPCQAAPGDLDLSFGSSGKVITDFFNNEDGAYAIAIQSDGKIVVAGYSRTPPSYHSDFAMARYNSDGSLDLSFGSGGKVVTDFGGKDDVAYAVAIQGDGKIVAVGSAEVGFYPTFGLVRYNIDGSFDSTFGTGGKIVTGIGSSFAVASALVIQVDGKIVVVGRAEGYFAAIARYNPDGTLDATFGDEGKVLTHLTTYWDSARAIGIQTDGKIVAAGVGGAYPPDLY